ncbi:hypothetical protein CRE_29532 [Caenorhabditis remanei]|uniref:Uncharacterized protein n=1 Tax=Caenorhabditis remanei TaxID=31234 RepID=E3LVI5_CAERE|nr:hypothetical protein CRE_29532 [Caenorhabditis remanei]
MEKSREFRDIIL